MLPFLRSAALFFHYLNSTTPPADLLGNCQHAIMVKWSCDSDPLTTPDVVSGLVKWEALCSYLCLPSNLLQLYHSQHTLLEPLIHRYTHTHTHATNRNIKNDSNKSMINHHAFVFDCYRWCTHPGVKQNLQGGGVIVRFPRESNRLICLPDDYSVLINQASSFTSVCLLLTLTVVILVYLPCCLPASHTCMSLLVSDLCFSIAAVLGQVETSLELQLCVWSVALCSVLRATAVRPRWTERMLAPAQPTPSPVELASDSSSGIASSNSHSTQSYTPH